MTDDKPKKPQTPVQKLAQAIRDHGGDSDKLRQEVAEKIRGGQRKKP